MAPDTDLMGQLWRISPAAMAAELTKAAVPELRWLPAPHLLMLSDWLVDAALGHRDRLIVTMPPQNGKSSLVSHWFPVWVLDHWPHKRIMLISYASNQAEVWGRRVRNTLQQHKTTLRARVSDDSSAVGLWTTTAGGQMASIGIDGPVAGKPADILIVDDPYSGPADAHSPAYRERAWRFYQENAYPRLAPGGIVVIMHTRWHEDDLIGRVQAQQREAG